jgi:general transcription factor 3C polypeptide 3 (transcription factor C subunit 4)
LAQEYAARRGNAQEAAYNLGRAAHQLGLLHLAAPFYERALAAQPPEGNATLDVRGEAAHNLAQLYGATGAHALAHEVVRRHLTV